MLYDNFKIFFIYFLLVETNALLNQSLCLLNVQCQLCLNTIIPNIIDFKRWTDRQTDRHRQSQLYDAIPKSCFHINDEWQQYDKTNE